MIIVNVNIKFTTRYPYELIKEIYPIHKEYYHKPSMLKIKVGDNTVILFKSLKGRIMGKPNNIELKFPIENQFVTNMTVVHNFNVYIDLEKTNFIYLPEIFAAGFKRFPEYCNLFHNGKLVILGVKTVTRAEQLIKIIYDQIHQFII